jgi:hypothetical protein
MEKDEKIKHKIIQTYAGDMAEVIEGNQEKGIIKKIIHEEEEYEKKKRDLSPESKKNKFFMFVGIFLIVLASITLSFFLFKKNINTVEVEKQFVPLIFNDQSIYLEVSGFSKDEIAQTVLNEVNTTKVKVGGVEGIYLTENKQPIGLRKFISLIKGNFIPGRSTLFVDDNFLMGAVLTGLKSTSPTAGDFFILLKVRSIADVFNSMRAWEEKMFSDLHGFLGINLSSDTNYLLTKNFEDGIIENKNARILYDTNGNIIVAYIFADDNSVVITSTSTAAHEITLRLTSSRTKQ